MIYLDNNATTFMPQVVKDAIASSLDQGNPSADYPLAVASAKKLENARDYLLGLCRVNREYYTAIFTSGASESNNFILRSMAEMLCKSRPHFILSAVEHKTSLLCVNQLAKCGFITASFVSPLPNGTVNAESVLAALQPNTVLVSIMSANNETGAINSISEIALAVKRVNPRILFHSDCVQTFGKIPPNMADGLIDAISISFHKIYGPTAAGALIINKAKAQMYSLCAMIAGTQNYGYRGGTENVSLIRGGVTGIQYAMSNREKKNNDLLALKTKAINAFKRMGNITTFGANMRLIPGLNFVIIGDPSMSLPTTILFSIAHLDSTSIKCVCNLKMKKALYEVGKVVVSVGSACNKSEPSHVLAAMNVPGYLHGGILRISFGDNNTIKDVDTLISSMSKILSKWILNRGF